MIVALDGALWSAVAGLVALQLTAIAVHFLQASRLGGTA